VLISNSLKYIFEFLVRVFLFAVTIHTAGRMYKQIRHVHTANEKIVLSRELS